MKNLCLFFTALLLSASMPAWAEQCQLSGYDQEFFIDLAVDSTDRTVFTSDRSASQSGDGSGLGFAASFCISNNPKMDIFWV